jgi:hypothetical protein
MVVVTTVPVVPATRDAHATHAAADAPPEPIATTGARPTPAAQATGQHQR